MKCNHERGFIQFRDRPQEWFCPNCEVYERDYRNEVLQQQLATVTAERDNEMIMSGKLRQQVDLIQNTICLAITALTNEICNGCFPKDGIYPNDAGREFCNKCLVHPAINALHQLQPCNLCEPVKTCEGGPLCKK